MRSNSNFESVSLHVSDLIGGIKCIRLCLYILFIASHEKLLIGKAGKAGGAATPQRYDRTLDFESFRRSHTIRDSFEFSLPTSPRIINHQDLRRAD
jgi:hypothetical protein